jgi:polyhydroxyalkanoate synthesis regulator phasin
MANLFEKGFLAGLGLLDLSQEKAKELVDELVKRGEMSRQEGAKFVQGAMERAQEERKTMEERLRSGLEGAFARMNLATKDDLARLEKRVAALEGHLEEMRRGAHGETVLQGEE